MKIGTLDPEQCKNKTLDEIVKEIIIPDFEKEKAKIKEENLKARKPETYEELMSILTTEHIDTFKDITLEAQLDKFIDEKEEYNEAENCINKARELADMFIVAAGIARFAPRFVDAFLVPCLIKKIEASDDYTKGIIFDLALEKSLINKERKWDKKEGKYQHI